MAWTNRSDIKLWLEKKNGLHKPTRHEEMTWTKQNVPNRAAGVGGDSDTNSSAHMKDIYK